MQWYVRTDPEARRMMDLKHRYGDYPNGNGPAESVAVKVSARLGERTRNFRNADRLASVISLMSIDISEQANAARYARSLRDRLAQDGWDPDLDWEAPHDLYGHYSSMADLMMTAWEREARRGRARCRTRCQPRFNARSPSSTCCILPKASRHSWHPSRPVGPWRRSASLGCFSATSRR